MSAEQIVDDLITQAVKGSGETAGRAAAPPQADPTPEGLQSLCGNKTEAEKKFNDASERHTSALAFGIPLFVLSLVLLAAYEDRLFRQAPYLAGTLAFGWRIATLWMVAALLTAPVYYFAFRRKYIMAKDALWKIDQSYIAMRLSTEAGRKQYFREELFRLSSKAARIFFEDEQRFAIASKWAERANNILDGTDTTATLSVVQSCLNSLNELVAREEREQKDENRWQYWAIAVMLLYVAVLIGSALITNKNPALLTAEVFGVPLSVILWGAAGSLAAILYRFYTEQGLIRFAAEFRWLIARPMIGIIMGAVVYLALISGMILVSEDSSGAVERRMAAFWIISFLAGFSDKFYLGVIDLLVARTVRTEEIDSNTVITERERIPEAAGAEQSGESKTSPQTAGT